ncbi:WD40-repeat-containing domain protein [Truncatella angustata]|uniref:WD40-repeat-containing domain protein n=1 Tax=Truncatella angustata TaxID=152316 RepID=A0A9P9A416_9PEZI|nr:WD40-repeat-containing domain protein [Truncatella angustata]KAH6660693.1 WD40-repeat-containing domain protein [Truncatella angustata]
MLTSCQQGAVNCSCTWTKDPETEVPWLCVAGWDAKIKIYDVISGTLVKTLVGHGAEINDLATCPNNPSILASASQDTTVRIWSLDSSDEDQPCLAILGGEGHSSGLLATAFHNSGRYVLSAGHDNCVCMWTLPDLSDRPRTRNPLPPVIVHYPHFFTSEVHSGIVDCVAFYGDMILSRACHEDVIVLWRIEGFSSKNPPPSPSDAPTTSDTERLTRSAFVPVTVSAAPQYTRMIQFHTPGSGHQFYMRFKLYHDTGKHPVLAFCNAHSNVFFWDLARITAFHEFVTELNRPDRDVPLQRPSWLQPVVHRQKADPVSKVRADADDRDSVISGRTGSDIDPSANSNNHYSQETLDSWHDRYDSTRIDEALRSHSQSSVSVKDFIGRQVAWSPLGDWCVVVGSKNLMVVLARWQKKEKDDRRSGH